MCVDARYQGLSQYAAVRTPDHPERAESTVILPMQLSNNSYS